MENEVIQNIENKNSIYETENNAETNEITTEVIQEDDVNNNILIEKLDVIHEDLGFICSFLIIFAIVGLLQYIYKFFSMFFKY